MNIEFYAVAVTDTGITELTEYELNLWSQAQVRNGQPDPLALSLAQGAIRLIGIGSEKRRQFRSYRYKILGNYRSRRNLGEAKAWPVQSRIHSFESEAGL